MMHGPEDRRDHDIVVDRSNENTYYDRDRCDPDPAYVDEDFEDVVDLIGSRRRRITIRRLAELVDEDDQLTIGLEELSREVGAIEDNVDPEIVNWRSLRSVKTGLRNNHLPQLDERGIIQWDPDERTVTTTDFTHACAALLESLEATIEGRRELW